MGGYRSHIAGAAAALLAVLAGCTVNSYFDPSKTGRFEYTPTTIPILDRIDVIERETDPFAKATGVTPQDLVPSDLTYRIAPGDLVTIEIFELMATGQLWTSSRRVDAGGNYRLPTPIGDVRAVALTAQEFQDEITRIVHERVMPNPMVNVVVEEAGAFSYTVYGGIQGTGLYSLRRADFRLLDALAQAGGVPGGTHDIYVIRQVPLAEQAITLPSRGTSGAPQQPQQPVDIESLIRQLGEPSRREGEGPTTAPPPSTPPAPPPATTPPETQPEQPPIDIEDLIDRLERQKKEQESQSPHVSPGFFAQEGGPPIDIEQLEPVKVPKPPPEKPPAAPATPPAQRPPVEPAAPPGDQTYIYVQERDEWVPVQQARPAGAAEGADGAPTQRFFVERIIAVPYTRLKQGDSSYNIVIRPSDRIYVREPQTGVVYIDGEIVRPGVYNFPATGQMTLSRLVAAAGGPGPLAIPTRVDLTRMVATSREATIRLNLAAIRQRTEPDIWLRPDDHVIIGTDFFAVPLAVFRNGLRMTYGFGFLLDRNFGNDVFGAPPVNVVGR